MASRIASRACVVPTAMLRRFTVRRRPRTPEGDLDWLLWGGALSGLVVTASAGLLNTTLHHEHGILVTLPLGLWLTNLPRHPRRAS